MSNPWTTLPNINFSGKQAELNKPKTFEKSAPKALKKIFPFWEYLQLKADTEQLVFIPGEYVSRVEEGRAYPWLEYYSHRSAVTQDGKVQYRECTCSAGLDLSNKKPCVGCYYYESNKPAPYTKKENRTPNPWGKKLNVVMCIVHLAWYKRVLRMKDGKPVTYNDVPQYNEVLCPAGEEGSEGSFFGKLLKVKLGNNHYKNWVEIASQLYWICDGCGTGIVTKKIYCRHCGADIIDPKEINKRTRPEQEEIVKRPVGCSCGATDLPLEDLACGYDMEGKVYRRKKTNTCPLGEAPPQRMSIFGCVVSLNKTGAKTDSKLNLIDKSSFNPDSDISWVAPTDNIGMPPIEIVNAAIERNGGKLYDIDKDIEIVPEAEQASILDVPNPYAPPTDMPKQAPIPQKPVTGGEFKQVHFAS